MKNIDFNKASFRDFENIPGMDAFATADYFQEYLDFLRANGHLNYRIESQSPVGPEMDLMLPGDDKPTRSVCLVSNDQAHLDKVLEAFRQIDKQLELTK